MKQARTRSTRTRATPREQPKRREPPPPPRTDSPLGQLMDSLSDLTSDITTQAMRLASRTRESAAKAIARTPEQLRMMALAGESLRDMREVAGMTVIEISDALNLRDKSIWEAVEDGREALSFELILRLASLVARNDPLPFVLRFTRTYHPRLWEILHELRIDQLPLQFERERAFINIYRRHDAARRLSDAEFERALRFTQDAFDLAIHFFAGDEPTHAPKRARKEAVPEEPAAEQPAPSRLRTRRRRA